MSEYDETFDTCDDCGRRFPRSELRRCKICGHYVCPECRGTHVARFHKAAVKPVQEQPSYAAPEYHGSEPTTYGNPIHQEPVHSRIPVTEPPVYHAAPASEEVMACVDCGREFPKSKLKKCNICNGAVCIHCQPSHLAKKHGHFLYSDFDAPATGTVPPSYVPPVVVPPVAEYQAPSSTIHFREELDENPIGQASADYSYRPDPLSDYPSSLMEDGPSDDPGDGRIKCDDCGGYFNKDELRTCKKCGHHVCPECRSHHKCPKPVKAEKPPKEPKEPKPPKEPKQHKRRKHDELGDPIY